MWFLVAVLKIKNVDHINRFLKLFKLHQYLISLLRKMQNTLLELAVKRFWLMGIFPKKESGHQTIDHINRTLNTFKLHQYLLSLLRNSQNTIFVKFFLKIANLGSIYLFCMYFEISQCFACCKALYLYLFAFEARIWYNCVPSM